MFNSTWTFRKHGGIFLGFKVHFPVTTQFTDGSVRTFQNLTVGLLVWQFGIDFIGKPQEAEDGWEGI